MTEQAPLLPTEIRGVLIELHDELLLLPNAAVAEVIDFREPVPQPESPGWLLGSVDWRQRNLVVVRLEALLGESMEQGSHRQRIVVCHTLGEGARRPFVGIVAQSIPRLVRVREELLEGVAQKEDDASIVVSRLMIDGQEALIPDLGELERWLNQS